MPTLIILAMTAVLCPPVTYVFKRKFNIDGSTGSAFWVSVPVSLVISLIICGILGITHS